MNKKLSIREITQMAIFTAIIAVCAQIAIPLPGGVPMTLQTWAVSLAGIVLGAKNGSLAVLVYVLLGIAGVPVFANFAGGLGIVAGPTGGFILTFPLMALIAGIGNRKKSLVWLFMALVAGTVINFAAGMFYFSFVTSVSLQAAFTTAVLPFIPSAILRIALLPAVAKSVRFAMAVRFVEAD